MQSTDLEEIRVRAVGASVSSVYTGEVGRGAVMAARKSRGQLLVLLRGRGRWHPAESVTIERPRLCPTGACDLEDGTQISTSTTNEAAKRLAASCPDSK